MARITEFFERPQERSGRHPTSVQCGYLVIDDEDETILQLTTYGSSTRAVPDKASQTFQLDRDAAKDLVTIIRSTFPGL